MKTIQEKIAEMPEADRTKVERRARRLIAEELTLRDLREAMARTQEAVAERLGIGQDSVSRLEKRSDMLLSTLRGYVAALGGRVRLVVEFEGRQPVELAGFAALKSAGKEPTPAPIQRSVRGEESKTAKRG